MMPLEVRHVKASIARHDPKIDEMQISRLPIFSGNLFVLGREGKESMNLSFILFIKSSTNVGCSTSIRSKRPIT